MNSMQLVLLFLWIVAVLALTVVLAMPCLARRWWHKSLPPPAPGQEPPGGAGGTGDAASPSAPEDAPPSDRPDAFHIVTSPVQEEEIREAYLRELLRHCTKSISFREEALDALPSAERPPATGSSRGDLSGSCMAVPTVTATSDIETGNYDSRGDYYDDDEESVGEVLVGLDAGDLAPTGGAGTAADETAVQLGGAGEPGPPLHYRAIPKSCAICLSSFKLSDAITWSSNPDCRHVFHHGCVLDWLKAAGSRHLRRRQRRGGGAGNERVVIRGAGDPADWITGLPTACPCCRREFVLPPGDGDAAAGETEEAQDAAPNEGEITSVSAGVEGGTDRTANTITTAVDTSQTLGVTESTH